MLCWGYYRGELPVPEGHTSTDPLQLASPWSNKIALVVGTQISTFKPSYLLGLSWAGTATTGYTKKLTVMSTCVVAAAVANMISPE